jgi:glycosyltransferase involved in cell wall biosynthesis
MSASYRVIIPTRDSARRIGQVLDAYRRIGVEPLYIVDARSSDGTLKLLQDLGSSCIPFTPHGVIAEAGMIEFGSRAAGTEWVLRMDDDEFPSQKLLDWVAKVGTRSSKPFWGVSRRDVCLRDEGFVYSRWPARNVWTGDCFCLNAQLRLHRVDAVRYIERLHTPGFETPPPHAYAPEDCFFIHFNAVVRSASDRVAKLRRYASLDEKLAWRFVDENLPELTDPAIHNYASDGLDEFSSLLETLPSPANDARYELTERERMLMAQGAQSWLADTVRAMQETMRVMQEELSREREASWLRLVPRPLLRPLAEFLLTMGRRIGSRTISEIGLRTWNFQKLRATA